MRPSPNLDTSKLRSLDIIAAPFASKIVKLPGRRPELPEKEISF
jgi:hypothetical protein